jgi:hypothetical protein
MECISCCETATTGICAVIVEIMVPSSWNSCSIVTLELSICDSRSLRCEFLLEYVSREGLANDQYDVFGKCVNNMRY